MTATTTANTIKIMSGHAGVFETMPVAQAIARRDQFTVAASTAKRKTDRLSFQAGISNINYALKKAGITA